MDDMDTKEKKKVSGSNGQKCFSPGSLKLFSYSQDDFG